MATANGQICPVIEDISETLLLYWLDAEVNTSDHNKIVQKQLRSIIKHFKTFNDQHECQQIIESLDEQDQLILIVSGQLGRQIVPQIHQLRQLSSIYVYCMNKESNEEWSKHFTKVREVIVELDDLITKINLAQKLPLKLEKSISYNIYSITENRDKSTTSLNDNFLHSSILITALLQLEPNPKDKQELISLLKKEYKGHKSQISMIDEFNDNYTPDKALYWCNNESFLYRVLNKVLRAAQQYIDLLFLFRFFISNIYEQLKQNQCKSPIRVYCGHVMWPKEIAYLKNQQNQYLSINTFLLTNLNRDKVLDVWKSANLFENEHQVLFIIDANPNVVTRKPFADITKFSNSTDEGEILFMIGCIFRLIEVEQEGQILMIRMELCGDNEHDLEQLYKSMKKIHEHQNEDHKIDFRTFGDILHRMGKYDLAEMIYRHLLSELPSNDSSLSDLHYALGVIAKDKHDYDFSLKSYQKSLEIKKRKNPSDFITIGKLYGCIGDIHRLKENDKEAIKYFEKAIKVFEKEHTEDHRHMSDFYDNMASIYKRQKKYNEALECYEKALIIDKKHSSSNSLNVAKSHNNMGIIYFLLNQYDLAMEQHQLSLSIKLKTLSPQHLSIAKSYMNIGSVYKTTGDLKQALDYYQKAATIYHHLLPSEHPDVIQTDNEIQIVFSELKSFCNTFDFNPNKES